jgi:hypothetical protein
MPQARLIRNALPGYSGRNGDFPPFPTEAAAELLQGGRRRLVQVRSASKLSQSFTAPGGRRIRGDENDESRAGIDVTAVQSRSRHRRHQTRDSVVRRVGPVRAHE